MSLNRINQGTNTVALGNDSAILNLPEKSIALGYDSFNEVNDIYENIMNSDVVSSAIKERVNKIHEFYSNQ